MSYSYPTGQNHDERPAASPTREANSSRCFAAIPLPGAVREKPERMFSFSAQRLERASLPRSALLRVGLAARVPNRSIRRFTHGRSRGALRLVEPLLGATEQALSC